MSSDATKKILPITFETRNKFSKGEDIYGSRFDKNYKVYPIEFAKDFDAYYTVDIGERTMVISSDLIVKEQPVKTFYNDILDEDFKEKDLSGFHFFDCSVRINTTNKYFKQNGITYCVYPYENVTYKKYYDIFPKEFLIEKLKRLFLSSSGEFEISTITEDEINFLEKYSLIEEEDGKAKEILKSISRIKKEIFNLIS